MSLAHRIIPCLDTDGTRVVKGVNFVGLRDAGDPRALAARYNKEGADELVVLDIAASRDRRPTFLETIRRVAAELSIPLTAGGGIQTLEDGRAVVRAGADLDHRARRCDVDRRLNRRELRVRAVEVVVVPVPSHPA